MDKISDNQFGGISIRVSLNLLTWNSSQDLVQCLESVYDLVDEIVVNDRFSTDRTLEILKEFNARIFQRNFSGSFADERNFLIKQSRGNFVLVLDSDERLSQEIQEDFYAHLKLMEIKKFVLGSYSRKNFIDNKLFNIEIPGHGRLFLRDKVTYFGRVHEQPLFRGTRVQFRDYFILHYKSSKKQKEQNERYNSLLQA